MENLVLVILIFSGLSIVVLSVVAILMRKRTERIIKNNEEVQDIKFIKDDIKVYDSTFTILCKSLITYIGVLLFWWVVNIILILMSVFILYITKLSFIPYEIRGMMPFTLPSFFSMIGLIYSLIRVRDIKVKYED